MAKRISSSPKFFSDIHLNWNAINSFISDVKFKETPPSRKMSETSESKPVITEKKESVGIEQSTPSKTFSVDSNKSPEKVRSAPSQPVVNIQKKTKEYLIDIVEELDAFEKARRGIEMFPIARVHCLLDDIGKTYWFTNRLYHPRELSNLRKFGSFVPKYSDIAIKLQKSTVGTSFPHDALNNINRPVTYQIRIENQSDLQNRTIAIAGDELTYQYRGIQEFLNALRQNKEDIKDVESKIYALEEEKKTTDNPHRKGQITISIKKFQEEYRILTQQQEDLKNITIYIRKQGEMRYSYIVDPIQTDIMSKHLFDGKTVVIKGGPGTGKTTTMIHRLAYLTDTYAIKEDEKKKLNKYKISALQRKQLLDAINTKRDWMFFSPSQMLKEYLADAMKQEGLADTNEKVWNWKDYSRKILQENYHLLELHGNNAPFKVCNSMEILFYQNSDITHVFTNFYLDELRAIKTKLPELKTDDKAYAWMVIAQNIQKRFEDVENYDLARFISLFNSLESVYSSDCKRLLSDRNKSLSELAEKICLILDEKNEIRNEIEEILEMTSDETVEEDSETDEYEEVQESSSLINRLKNSISPFLGKKSSESPLSGEIQKWLKAYCHSKVSEAKELSEEQKIITEILLPVIENKFDDEILKIGNLMIFEQFAQYTRGVRIIMLNGMPARYKRFRTFLNKTKFEGCNQTVLRGVMQNKQGRELHHQEQSLLLGFINTLVKQIKASINTKINHEYIEAYEEVARPIIGIDEVTDFTICDIYAMQSLLTRGFNSLTLCGDMMQRMTRYGIDSWDELEGVVINPVPFEMKTSYRQSKKLLEVAKQLCIDTLGETPSYKAFMKSNKVPAPLVYIDDMEYNKIEWISKRISEVVRAYGDNLPSIAIFVTDKGYIPHFIDNLQNTKFFIEKGIKVLDGTNASNIPENHICVYPIDSVKGMEFDVVFFHNIDKTDAEMDLVKRYIYVGVSRAAFFLGITMNEEIREISKYFEKNKNWFKI